ncbi:hypothetical protein TYRP_008671 [Tyrophagus putrescentiae]|nr:hypothetical protein TYRP_008671 [Tyrophagus putrescentiae]
MATVVEVAVDMTTCPGVVEAETELAVVGTVDREALKRLLFCGWVHQCATQQFQLGLEMLRNSVLLDDAALLEDVQANAFRFSGGGIFDLLTAQLLLLRLHH